MLSGSTPDGLTSYYVNDKLIVTVVYDGSVMKLQVVSQ